MEGEKITNEGAYQKHSLSAGVEIVHKTSRNKLMKYLLAGTHSHGLGELIALNVRWN